MNSILQTTPALDEFMSETTASYTEPIAPRPVFELSTLGITRCLDVSVRKFHWLLSVIAILFAGYSGLEILRGAQTAPAQAASAAIALMIAIVPYLFARAVDELVG